MLITKKNDLTVPLFIKKSGHGPAEKTRGMEVDKKSSASDVAMAEAMSVKATEDCLFVHGEARYKQGETNCMCCPVGITQVSDVLKSQPG